MKFSKQRIGKKKKQKKERERERERKRARQKKQRKNYGINTFFYTQLFVILL